MADKQPVISDDVVVQHTITDKQPVISDDVVVQHALPRPSICLRGQAKREVRMRVTWRQCK